VVEGPCDVVAYQEADGVQCVVVVSYPSVAVEVFFQAVAVEVFFQAVVVEVSFQVAEVSF